MEPAHFIERHGLIVIIAIGESLIAIGLGERDSGLTIGVIVAAILGFVVATSFWLAYFDFFPIRARRLLADRSGVERTPLARDVYTYLHALWPVAPRRRDHLVARGARPDTCAPSAGGVIR